MLRLLLSVGVEAIVAISLAGLVLAIMVPALSRYWTLNDGQVAELVMAVLACLLAAVLLRPASAINRWRRR
jgi:hypothetical protein